MATKVGGSNFIDKIRSQARSQADELSKKGEAVKSALDKNNLSLVSNSKSYNGQDAGQYLTNLVNNAGEAPVYSSQYQSQLDGILEQIMNRGSFEYDQNKSDIYQQYKDMYTANGNKAMRDTMGNAAALTGGYGSSYASTAGSQAYDSYMEQLNNASLDLRNQAYNEYNQATLDMINKYSTLQSAEEAAYQKYLNEYNQYQNNREMAYSIGNAAINQYNTDRNYEADQAYNDWYKQFQEGQAATSADQWQKEYNLSLDKYNYSKEQDAISNQIALLNAQNKGSSTDNTTQYTSKDLVSYIEELGSKLKSDGITPMYNESQILDLVLEEFDGKISQTTLSNVLRSLGLVGQPKSARKASKVSEDAHYVN